MNTKALKKHEIYNNLNKLDEDDLDSLVDYVHFLMSKKQRPKEKIIKLKGIISKYKIDLSLLQDLKSTSWKHLEKEISNE